MKIKIRLQILLAIMILGIVAVLGLVTDYVEVSTACVAGIVGFAMKLAEKE